MAVRRERPRAPPQRRVSLHGAKYYKHEHHLGSRDGHRHGQHPARPDPRRCTAGLLLRRTSRFTEYLFQQHYLSHISHCLDRLCSVVWKSGEYEWRVQRDATRAVEGTNRGSAWERDRNAVLGPTCLAHQSEKRGVETTLGRGFGSHQR